MSTEGQGPLPKALGFWACWSLTVGTMIGSGIFTVPAVLAPYGVMSFAGWALSGVGTILLALTIGRLASRTQRTGGPYAYVHDTFGDASGFLTAWAYWISFWSGIPGVAIASVGYMTVFAPGLTNSPAMQAVVTLAIIWALTFVAIRGVRESSVMQMTLTALKLVPLLVIALVAVFAGSSANLQPATTSEPIGSALAATALLTMWAFSSFEAGCVPAGNVVNPTRTIPRAIIFGTVTVTVIYLAVNAAAMLLLSPGELAKSPAPLAEAARVLGEFGPALIAAGAIVSTAGSMNGAIFITGQLPMAVALDKLAPAILAKRNAGGSPYVSLILGSSLASLLVLTNYTRGLVGAFTFFIMMSTLTYVVPLLGSVAAEIRHSWRDAPGWAAVAALAGLYCVFIVYGSGIEPLIWCGALLAVGVPVYLISRRAQGARAEA